MVFIVTGSERFVGYFWRLSQVPKDRWLEHSSV